MSDGRYLDRTQTITADSAAWHFLLDLPLRPVPLLLASMASFRDFLVLNASTSLPFLSLCPVANATGDGEAAARSHTYLTAYLIFELPVRFPHLSCPVASQALLNMAKRQPKSPEVHFFLALHFLREHQPAKALSAFEAAAAAVAALPEERMSQPRRDLHSAVHRHMAQCHLELAMLAAPAAADAEHHHHHHHQHLNISQQQQQQQHPHKQQKQHQQNQQQQQQQQRAAHASDADVVGGTTVTGHKQSSAKAQGKAQVKDQVKLQGKVQAKGQLKGPRRGVKMEHQAQKKGEKRGKRAREKEGAGLSCHEEKHGEERSLPDMDQGGGSVTGKRKFEGDGAVEGGTDGLDVLDGLFGLAGS
ncbi:unnamed protein product [Closterium sp. NIES-53]